MTRLRLTALDECNDFSEFFLHRSLFTRVFAKFRTIHPLFTTVQSLCSYHSWSLLVLKGLDANCLHISGTFDDVRQTGMSCVVVADFLGHLFGLGNTYWWVTFIISANNKEKVTLFNVQHYNFVRTIKYAIDWIFWYKLNSSVHLVGVNDKTGENSNLIPYSEIFII